MLKGSQTKRASFLAALLCAFFLNEQGAVAQSKAKKVKEKPATVAAIPRLTELFSESLNPERGGDGPQSNPLQNRRHPYSMLLLRQQTGSDRTEAELRQRLAPQLVEDVTWNRIPIRVSFDPANIFGARSSARVYIQDEYLLDEHWADNERSRKDENKVLKTLGGTRRYTLTWLRWNFDSAYLQGGFFDDGVALGFGIARCSELLPTLCAKMQPQITMTEGAMMFTFSSSISVSDLVPGLELQILAQPYLMNPLGRTVQGASVSAVASLRF